MANKQSVVFFLLLVIGLITYFPSVFGTFLWDDYDFIVDNIYVQTMQIDKFFTAQATEGAGRLSNYYRPIQFTIYAILYAIVGPNPLFFHLANIFIHIGAAITLFAFLSQLTRVLFAFIVSLLFLVHPIQTEAVSYISGLSDPLVGFFGFATLYAFMIRRHLLAIALFLFALLSKESGIVMLGILILLTIYRSSKQSLYTLFICSFIAFFYLLYHGTINVMDMGNAFGNHPYRINIFIRIATFLSILHEYILLLVLPRDLFYDRDFSVELLTTPWHVPSMIVLLFIGVICSVLLKYRLSLLAYLSFFLALAPFSGIIIINGIMYEHFLYLAIPFFFLCVLSLFPSKRTDTRFSFFVFMFICLLIARSWIRQYDWIDPIRFYHQTISNAPNSFRAHNNFGLEYLRMEKYQEAIESFQRAIVFYPSLPNAYHNIATVFMKQKKHQNAERYFQKAIQEDPEFGYSYAALINLYRETNQEEKLKRFIEETRKKFAD